MAERINSSSSSRSARGDGFSSGRASSCKVSEDPDYFEVAEGIAIRPPSGTNHQQPGSHLSVDTRLEQLGLGSDSWIAKSEVEGHVRNFSHDPMHGTGLPQDRARPRFKVVAHKPNLYVASPFKQGPEPKRSGPVVVVDPSLELKERTRANVKKTRNKLRSAKPPTAPISHSARLTKARLRHMGRPMTASGPPIDQCKGIFAGRPVARYSVCSPGPRLLADSAGVPLEQHSRTTSPPSKPRSPNEFPRPADTSVHLNSCASSVQDRSCDCPTEESDSVDVENLIDAWTLRGVGREFELVPAEDAGFVQEPGELLRSSAAEFRRGQGFLSKEDFGGTSDGRNSTEEVFYRAHYSGDENDVDSKGNTPRSRTCGITALKRVVETSYYDKDELEDKSGGTNADDFTRSTFYCGSDDKYPRSEKVKDVCESFTGHFCADAVKSNVNDSKEANSESVIKESERERPIMEVQIKRTTKTATEKSLTHNDRSNNGECAEIGGVPPLEFDVDAVDLLDGDDIDTDRIPSAFLWKTLDALSLSSANLFKDSHSSKFSSKPRSKSAGCRSSSRNMDKAKKNYSKSRSERPKTAPKKEKERHEYKDSFGEASKLLLGQRTESSLRATLPGYFTEQYKNILGKREKESEKPNVTCGSIQEWALVKVECDERREDHNAGDKEEDISEGFPDSHRGEDAKQRDTFNQHFVDKTESNVSGGEVTELQSSWGVFVTVEERMDSGMDSRTRSPEVTSSGVEHAEGSPTTGLDDGLDCTCTPEAAAKTDDRCDDPSELEVVASAKQLSEPRYQKQKKALAPFPPVCFPINAQPPAGSVFYFAYGADMNPKRMAIYLRREIKSRLWGVLFGFRLCFNKRGNSVEAGGFPNVQFSPGDSVEGCVYTISGLELSMLDNCVGYPKHYTRAVLPVWMLNSKEPSEHGVAQFCVPSVLYVAQDDWVVHENEDRLDSKLSISQCLKARDILSPNYVAFLSSLLP